MGINSSQQRIARTGQEIYQSLLRLSLRDPTSKHDVVLVVMDKHCAEWLPQWFEPAEQVEVAEIDSSGVIKRKASRTGRPALGERPMSNAERQRRYREQRRQAAAKLTICNKPCLAGNAPIYCAVRHPARRANTER